MIKGLTYAILTTRDMGATRRFFTEQLGLAAEEEIEGAFSQFTTREGSMWAIMAAQEHNTPREIELYLLVDDVDAAYAAWKQRGVETVSEPHNEEFGRTFAFKDPEGRTLHAYARAG
ncbi:MAG TPA: VOC family protein [Dehalococcoidia bacterium]|nr:VOC family protein [Dehalococcoidia bacterium]